MMLEQVMRDVPVVRWNGKRNIEIQGISYDARRVEKKHIFCTWKGEKADGHRFVSQAIERGASVVVGEKDLQECVVETSIEVESGRRALGLMSANYFDHPAQQLEMIGITGTNGKTSTAYLIHYLYQQCGKKTGLIGTIDYRFGDWIEKASHTTPESFEIHRLLSEMKNRACDAVVMEVSSHALDQSRVIGIPYSAAIFTNLTQDHLDYHGNMEAYFEAKSKLFRELKASAIAVINRDDLMAERLMDIVPDGIKIVTYGIEKEADYKANAVRYAEDGTEFSWKTPTGTFEVKIPLVGKFNLSNVLAASSLLAAQEVNSAQVVKWLENAPAASGRLERVPIFQEKSDEKFSVIIDYAHTPDALQKVLEVLKPLTKGKLRVLVGCGGDRDKGKRPLMALAACEKADHVVFTSDNPRSEEPMAILNDMLEGARSFSNYEVVENRKDAIETLIRGAAFQDVLLIAGKGHEAYQEIQGKRFNFSDHEVVSNYFNLKKGEK